MAAGAGVTNTMLHRAQRPTRKSSFCQNGVASAPGAPQSGQSREIRSVAFMTRTVRGRLRFGHPIPRTQDRDGGQMQG